jgi:hypothetical protein
MIRSLAGTSSDTTPFARRVGRRTGLFREGSGAGVAPTTSKCVLGFGPLALGRGKGPQKTFRVWWPHRTLPTGSQRILGVLFTFGNVAPRAHVVYWRLPKSMAGFTAGLPHRCHTSPFQRGRKCRKCLIL